MRTLKIILVLLITSLSFLTQNITALYADGENQTREIIFQQTIEKGDVKIEVSLIRMAPGKIVALVKFPKGSEAKVHSLSLQSPSGKKYKVTAIKTLRSTELKEYLNSISSIGGSFDKFCQKIESFFIGEAYANCGHCGGAASKVGQESQDGVSSGFVELLFSALAEDVGFWLFVCEFDVAEKAGRWDMNINYYDKGKRKVINTSVYMDSQDLTPDHIGNFPYVDPRTEINPEPNSVDSSQGSGPSKDTDVKAEKKE